MSPIVALVALTAIVWLVARWKRAGGGRGYDARTEWPSWAFAAAAIGVAAIVSGTGRQVQLSLAAALLIPGGVYLIVNAKRGQTERDRKMRRYGWLAILVGALSALAIFSSLAVTGN